MTLSSNEDFEPSIQAKLTSHLTQGWESTSGFGLRFKLGKSQVQFGGDGSHGWGSATLGYAALALASGAKLAATGSGFGLGQGIALVCLTLWINPAFKGAGAAWSEAKARGQGGFGAFSSYCRRVASVIMGRELPNVASIPLLAVGLPALVADAAYQKSEPGSRFEKAAERVDAGFAKAMAPIQRWHARMDRWRAGKLALAARLDGTQATQAKAYEELGLALLRKRWNLAPGDDSGGRGLGHLAPAEKELRTKHSKRARQAWSSREEFGYALDRFEAAQGRPWHRPAPGLPSFAELAHAFNRRCEADEADEAMDKRIAEMKAQAEGWDIISAVGQAERAIPAFPKAKARL